MNTTAIKHDDESWGDAQRNWRVRTSWRLPVAIEVTMQSEHNFYAGITGNISEGGVFVCTDTPPPVGAELEFVLALPGSTARHRIIGKVCWVRHERVCGEGVEPGFGAQWVVMPADAYAAIAEFVQQRETILFDV